MVNSKRALLTGGDPAATEIALADRAHEVMRQFVALRGQIEVRFLALGVLLREIKGDMLYRAYGCDIFEDFLGLPEVGLSRSHAYRLMDVAATFAAAVPPVGQPAAFERLAAVGVRKLAAIAPLVRADPAQASEWLDKAEALSASALDEEIAESRGVVRSEGDLWYERRWRQVEYLARQARQGQMLHGKAADAAMVELMRIREAVDIQTGYRQLDSGEYVNREAMRIRERAKEGAGGG